MWPNLKIKEVVLWNILTVSAICRLHRNICIGHNIDVIHLGIIMVVNMAVGFVTPPFGVTLFVASPLCDTPPMRLGRKAVPFIITFLIALMFITFIPQISLCLL